MIQIFGKLHKRLFWINLELDYVFQMMIYLHFNQIKMICIHEKDLNIFIQIQFYKKRILKIQRYSSSWWQISMQYIIYSSLYSFKINSSLKKLKQSQLNKNYFQVSIQNIRLHIRQNYRFLSKQNRLVIWNYEQQ
ncbi:unnamed protein product [Paramecium sonneborni]|uniref:Uncharacterized protein n=1 Tax=Paramecium sonneborni TaxID=65129 RepID=A0A8S1QNT5_9CILI|nr:unnamed protein product [Paramecium sonneborni]